MMLKTLTILFFVAVAAALPFDGPDSPPTGQLPAVDSQGPEPVGDGSDLKADSTFWGFYGYPSHRRSFYAYRPYHRYYYYPTYYPTYWGHHW